MANDFEFTVPDMNCDNCKATIERVTKTVSGLESLNADPETKQVKGAIEQDDQLNEVKSRIERAGFTVEGTKSPSGG